MAIFTEDNFQSADVVLTPCDTYTSFCCGQDQAARNCCSTGAGTVRIPAGAAMLSLAAGTGTSTATFVILSTSLVSVTPSATSCASTDTSNVSPLKVEDCSAERNATIGLGVALGCAVAAAAFLWYLWRDGKKLKNVPLANPTRGELE